MASNASPAIANSITTNGYDVELIGEINGVVQTVYTVRCSSQKEQDAAIKGLTDWGHYIANA